jgi:hypothetical protein
MHARLSLPRVFLPHTYTQDGWFLQPERRPARLPRRTIFSRCICRCSRMRTRLSPPASSSLTHTRRMDGFCNQNADQHGSFAGLSFSVVYVSCSRMRARLSLPASSSLTHTRRMDGFCNQNADQLGFLAGLSFPVVYVGVVECATASPYTYYSSTQQVSR